MLPVQLQPQPPADGRCSPRAVAVGVAAASPVLDAPRDHSLTAPLLGRCPLGCISTPEDRRRLLPILESPFSRVLTTTQLDPGRPLAPPLDSSSPSTLRTPTNAGQPTAPRRESGAAEEGDPDLVSSERSVPFASQSFLGVSSLASFPLCVSLSPPSLGLGHKTVRDKKNMDLLLIFSAAALLIVPSLYAYIATVAPASFPSLKNKRICLLIAHPDDEAMFFAPTVLALTRPETGNHVKILCLSTGTTFAFPRG